MGVHTLIGKDKAVMYCSTTDWSFGPVFTDSDDHDAADRVDSFLRWLKTDPRQLDDAMLEMKYHVWLRQEDAQWDAEKRAEEQKSREDEDYKPWGARYDNPGED